MNAIVMTIGAVLAITLVALDIQANPAWRIPMDTASIAVTIVRAADGMLRMLKVKFVLKSFSVFPGSGWYGVLPSHEERLLLPGLPDEGSAAG